MTLQVESFTMIFLYDKYGPIFNLGGIVRQRITLESSLLGTNLELETINAMLRLFFLDKGVGEGGIMVIHPELVVHEK
jgi:hypothetical protein